MFSKLIFICCFVISVYSKFVQTKLPANVNVESDMNKTENLEEIKVLRNCVSENCDFNKNLQPCCDDNYNCLNIFYNNFTKLFKPTEYCKEILMIYKKHDIELIAEEVIIKHKNNSYKFDEICKIHLPEDIHDEELNILCIKTSDKTINSSSIEEIDFENFTDLVIRKCCESDEVMKGKTCERSKNISKLFYSTLRSRTDIDNFVYQKLQCGENNERTIIDEFEISNNGSIYWVQVDEFKELDSYCLELITDRKGDYVFQALICVSENEVLDISDVPIAGKFYSK